MMLTLTGLADLHPNPKRPNGNGLQAFGKPATQTCRRVGCTAQGRLAAVKTEIDAITRGFPSRL